MMHNHYSVLVAEDEEIILRNIVSLIEQNNPSFRIIGTALNGVEAVKILDEVHPDVLITDIRMPQRDGLDIIRYIHNEKLGTVSLILSGYDKFEYAQQALDDGAKGYLLKPVSPAQLTNALNNLASQFETEHKAKQEINLQRAISGTRIDLPVNFSHYRLLLVCTGNFVFSREAHIYSTSSESVPLIQLAETLINDSESMWFTQSHNKSEHYLLFGFQNEDRAQEFPEKLYQVLREFTEVNKLSAPVHVCVSNPISQENLASEANRIYENIRSKAVIGKDIFIDNFQKSTNDSIQKMIDCCSILEEKLEQSLLKRDLAQFKIALREEVNYWQKIECPTNTILNLIKSHYIRFYEAISSSSHVNLIPLRLDWDLRFDIELSLVSSWDQLYESLTVIFTGLLNDQIEFSNSEMIIKRIDDYICQNYMHPISNQSLARKFGFVPSYISKLFKNYKGLSPGDYLTQIRIDKAKDLISSNINVHLGDVAIAVGFSDPSYFGRLFKKMTGMSPAEYKTSSRHS
jgi:two-component system, response regulator YesN